MVLTLFMSVWVVTGACAVGRVNKASFQILSYLSLFMTSSTSGFELISFLAGERSVLRKTSLYLMIVGMRLLVIDAAISRLPSL